MNQLVPSILHPLLPHMSKTGLLLISNIMHSKWPIQFMVAYRPDGRLDTLRMILHDGSNTVLDVVNI